MKSGASLTYSRIPCEPVNFLSIFISQLESSKLILLFVDTICFDHRAEDWKSIFDIE